MSRKSNIATHPKREQIMEDIALGVPGAEIARTYTGVSESGVSRARIAHFDALASVLDDGVDVPDLLGRLADVADSTRAARKLADATGSPATRARAQTNELAALKAMFQETGVTSTTALRIAEEAGVLVKALREFLSENPAAVPAWVRILGGHEELIEMRDTLKALAKNEGWLTR